MRTLVLIDGEHYPPVTRWAIDIARSRGHDVVAALLMGGAEKLAAGEIPDVGVPVRSSDGDRAGALAAAIDDLGPAVVLDLSDEPVLGYRERMEVAAVALDRGVPYVGADFRFDPPPAAPAPIGVPTLSVFGTGKRTGKTAISGEVARIAAHRGLAPIVVAMGRGGPPEPQVAEAGSVDLDALIGLVGAGAARRLGLPRGRADHGGHDDRRPARGGWARRRAVRQQRRGGGGACRRARSGAPHPGG